MSDRPVCRCGREVNTPFCPHCGRKYESPLPPVALLIYLKGQRAKTHAWITRTETHMSALSAEEREKRLAKHRGTLARWDRWVEWVENHVTAEALPT